MSIIEGTYGPIPAVTTPTAGTDEVQTLTLDADGGTFRLAFEGFETPDIAWGAVDNTLIAAVSAALQGTAEVQTLTFAAITSGTFKLRMRGQTTADIAWSGTSNTLRDNVDSALEAISPVGSAGCVVAVGTMTSGLGTLTVTFAAFGPQPPIEVAERRLVGTGAAISAARTTPGTLFPPGGKLGIVASDGTLTSGIGTILLTFSGAHMAKKAQPLITVADNSLTGTGTCTVEETTPGVDADGRGAALGALAVDTATGKLYANVGTAELPTWTVVGSVT